MSPQQILDQMGKAYAECVSYSDGGSCDFRDIKGMPEQILFRTQFVRPDYYCFEWQDYGPRRGKSEQFSILWSDQDETYVRFSHGLERIDSLGLAVAGATGCSAGVACVIPALLFEECRVNSMHLLQLRDLKLLRQETLDGDECYVVQGSQMKYGDRVLWIATKDFSLRHVHDDRSWTAEESRREHVALMADTETLARLREKGIAPPSEMKHTDTEFILEFRFRNVRFNESIVRLPSPASL